MGIRRPVAGTDALVWYVAVDIDELAATTERFSRGLKAKRQAENNLKLSRG
jgi:hypothetical protein